MKIELKTCNMYECDISYPIWMNVEIWNTIKTYYILLWHFIKNEKKPMHANPQIIYKMQTYTTILEEVCKLH